jgi:alginate O-acetyltransferase complex protein AlgI
MLVSGTIDYVVGNRIARTESAGARRAWLVTSLVTNLGLLAWFKYGGLLARTTAAMLAAFGVHVPLVEAWTALNVTLPPGISFYTFQTLSYTIDVYRRTLPPARSFRDYAAFVTFFPQLVAGPIARYDMLGKGIERAETERLAPEWKTGTLLFFVGLCKKVLLADRLANLIDQHIASIGTAPMPIAWLCLVGYALQIYFDFSGYSDMALGLGHVFRLDLPINFDSPYKAVNPSDFWRRWHITLSTWIRDYLYIPLGGSRGSRRRVALNLVLTMGLAGLWHGANWTFVAWGAYHGVLLVMHRLAGARWDAAPAALQRGVTFVLVCLGWVFFRAPGFSEAGAWFIGLAGGHGFALDSLPEDALLALLVAVGLGIAQLAPNSVELDLANAPMPHVAGLALLSSIALLLMNYSSVFIYYQF